MVKYYNKSHLREQSLKILASMRYATGLYAASRKDVNTGYDKVWIRDNIYNALGMLYGGRKELAQQTIMSILEILKKHESKINWVLLEKPKEGYKYIHPRYHPTTFEEYPEPWGFKQHDAIGALLFVIGKLYPVKSPHDRIIIQKLVDYLEKVEYWHDPDNGIWEHSEEVHASSVGACLAGLISVNDIVNVKEELIAKGRKALDVLLPKECLSRDHDLALLSLIFPFKIVSGEHRDAILKGVEENLVRSHGVIRFKEDWYYKNEHGEAEWVMGFPWLARIYKELGNTDKYILYLGKTLSLMTKEGELPELYLAGISQPNENTPLAWAQSMLLMAIA